MKIGIYNPYWRTLGGGEKYLLRMAYSLTRYGEVTVIADRKLDLSALENYFDVNTEAMGFEVVRSFKKTMSKYDIGFILSNRIFYGNHAKKNVYMIQVPISRRWSLYRTGFIEGLKEADFIISNSEFTAGSLLKNHSLLSYVLPPPIDDLCNYGKKANVILSVGRFFEGRYNNKRHDVLIEAFRLFNILNPGWQLKLAGSCSDKNYLNMLKAKARDYPITFYPDIDFGGLVKLYNESKLYWSAAGYGVDESRFPEKTEHFGMSVVEAMSAYCVPVVVNNGGHRDIITHGKDGYLYDTIDELIGYSNDYEEITSVYSRIRFEDYSYKNFSKRLDKIMVKMGEGRTGEN